MIGTSLQRYEILEELGQGGMSVVYRGHDTALDREVAVKVLHEHLAKDSENRQRFRREARAIARLEHDHILDVFDYSDEADDRSFIVMEYIPGMNLRDFVDRHGTPPPEVAAMVGLVVADALDHAHGHGVIHRDLKPDNIMVSEEGKLKLMDFGIAHVADAETMTQTGNLLGSPAHMAPEIIDGEDVNARSDIFSFGTVLYWLSTGSFPFQGDNAPHLLRQVLECNYEDPESVEPRMPRELSRVIRRCLSREPDDRFEDVGRLREELSESLSLLGDLDIAADLESYFHDPEEYTARFESAVVDRLVERGRAAMERGEVPEAIAHFNRVLAYEPDNETVQRELEELDEETIGPAQVAVLIGVVLVATGAVAFVSLVPNSSNSSTVDPARSGVTKALERAATVAARRMASRDGGRAARTIRATVASVRARSEALDLASVAIRRAESVAGGPRRAVATTENGRGESAPSANAKNDAAGSAARPSEGARPAESAPAPDTGTGRDVRTVSETETFTYKFKVLPLAATVYIDGREYSAPEVSNGIELERGLHRIRAVSPGCKPFESRFEVDGPRDDKISVVLEWKPASVEVVSNVPAVIYVDGDRNRPHRTGTDSRRVRIEVPFGDADTGRSEIRRETTLEVRAQHDFELVRRQSVDLRPGEETSVKVNFPRDGR